MRPLFENDLLRGVLCSRSQSLISYASEVDEIKKSSECTSGGLEMEHVTFLIF